MSVQKFNARSRITNQVIPYTQVNNAVIQNIKNPEAGFVWVYLLSKPSDWLVMKAHIKGHFGFGDSKIKKIFAYLKKHNLICYHQIKDEKGRITHTDIETLNGEDFIINPEVKKLSTAKESTGSLFHRVENQTSGKQGTTKKRDYKPKSFKEKDIQRKEETSFFKPTQINIRYALTNDIPLELEIQRFNTKYPYKKTQYAFKRWLDNAIEYRNKMKPNNEARSNVPWFGDNH